MLKFCRIGVHSFIEPLKMALTDTFSFWYRKYRWLQADAMDCKNSICPNFSYEL